MDTGAETTVILFAIRVRSAQIGKITRPGASLLLFVVMPISGSFADFSSPPPVIERLPGHPRISSAIRYLDSFVL